MEENREALISSIEKRFLPFNGEEVDKLFPCTSMGYILIRIAAGYCIKWSAYK
ncbi:MAG: hypothetical protein JRN10_05105 [Nitrososphaerota archaeon]|jgi:hypothetical protein|nr:hypothetical protein [Nitrososphaerota archaeon]MDG6930599.1 hypothetical protein [Nitrososphaerota archaeon]